MSEENQNLETAAERAGLGDSAREIVLEEFEDVADVLEAGDTGLMQAGLGPVEAARLIEHLDDAAPPRSNGTTVSDETRHNGRHPVPEPEPEPEPEQTGEPEPDGDEDDGADNSIARRAGGAVARVVFGVPMLLLSVPLAFGRGLVGYLPGKTRIYRKMIVAGYKQMYKKTDAHVIVDTVYADGERVPRPAEIDKEENKLKTANGEWWTVSNGLEKQFIGDTPTVTGVADQHETVDHVGARVAEAVDMGPSRYTTVEQTGNGFAPPQQAVADGGGNLPGTTFDDIWLDTSNPEPENDGWIVSLRKHYEMHFDRAGSEEMERQETRGILSAEEPDTRSEWIKILLFVGGLALGMFGPALAAAIGGGGGSGGSPVPGGLGMIQLVAGAWL